MNKSNFIAALKKFGEECNTDVIPVGESSFELKFREVPTNQRHFLRLVMTINDENVSEINYRCMCGAIEDPNALPSILMKNYGGVMDTEFYFSAKAIEDYVYLFLETKLYVDPKLDDKDEVTGMLGTLWLHPLWVRQWDFPKGVENFLW
jgi:hypothetical protein